MSELFESAFAVIEERYLVFFPDYLYNGFREFQEESTELFAHWFQPSYLAINHFVRRCRTFFYTCILLGYIPKESISPYTFDSSLPTVSLAENETEMIPAPDNATQYMDDIYKLE
jgi:hypothetical protein